MHSLGLMDIHTRFDEVVEFDLVGSGAFLDVSASELLLDIAHEFAVGDAFLACVNTLCYRESGLSGGRHTGERSSSYSIFFSGSAFWLLGSMALRVV